MRLRRFSKLCDGQPGIFAVLLAVAAGCGDAGEPPPTSAAAFDAAQQAQISVSGMSSGAYMAVQAHVAFADKIGGIAAVAGGPYHCAAGDVQLALARCLTGAGLDPRPLIEFARAAADDARNAATEQMAADRIWIFHSPVDTVVAPAVGAALRDFYADFVADPAQIEFVDDVETAHGWPTVDAGASCLEWGGDFINACDFDTAGRLLGHIYGELLPRAPAADPDSLFVLDVSRYFGDGNGVADTAYVYAPENCRAATSACRLHLAFHGCVQGAEFIDDRFVRQAGFNEWAETNDIVVVYPQIEKSLFNPKGCWDWWGYSGEDYEVRAGKQLAGVGAIIDAFVSGTLLKDIENR